MKKKKIVENADASVRHRHISTRKEGSEIKEYVTSAKGTGKTADKEGKPADGSGAWSCSQCNAPHNGGARQECRLCFTPKPPREKAAPGRTEAREVPVPMDSGSDLGDCSDGEDSGTQALPDKGRKAAAKQILGMLQMLGANTPMECLKAAGLQGISITDLVGEGGKAKR